MFFYRNRLSTLNMLKNWWIIFINYILISQPLEMDKFLLGMSLLLLYNVARFFFLYFANFWNFFLYQALLIFFWLYYARSLIKPLADLFFIIFITYSFFLYYNVWRPDMRRSRLIVMNWYEV